MAEALNAPGGSFAQKLKSIGAMLGDWAGALWSLFKRGWRKGWLFKLAYLLAGSFLLAWFLVWLFLARGLPDAETLLEYEPPLPTMVRGIDGEIVDSYARERRVQLQFRDFPQVLIDSYLSAEDKTFWTHGGVDVTGFAGAVVDYVSKIGSGERARGGSTITQQVAKNILVGNEYSITRKLREMILARRIEGVLEKEEILELYLNEIPLGRRSYGVQAASRAYFDKDVADLELHEAAFLAILPKAPEVYGRPQNREVAIERRNWVLDEMVDNDQVTQDEAEAAKGLPLGLVSERTPISTVDSAYFMEEVRRQLIDLFGEQAEDGPDSVYAGGLWVRTSLDTEMQQAASDALRAGLIRYHGNRGWTGPIATINLEDGSWRGQLQSSFFSTSYENWRIGVVISREGPGAVIGFSNGDERPLMNLPDRLRPGDIVAAEPVGEGYEVRTIPEVSGGFLAQDPATGRVLAMQGGFEQRLNSFNRATQALRQPGSTIKPFVYATALDNGFTPASMVPDEPYCVYQGAALGEHCFRNFGGQGGTGDHTMRWGLEQSRNLMTVHVAAEVGMNKVTDTFRRVGIGDYEAYLSFALGAGDTTVANMVNGYSAIANHGLQPDQTFIDFVQDRHGKVIWRADKRRCNSCNMDEWDGQPMPRFQPVGTQVLDARTAFQVVHMLTGVVQRGTAVRLRDLNFPLFGKTGTTNGPTNAWFVGGSPDVVAGVYIGYDEPRNLGGYVQGGNTAAPIFKQFVQETRSRWTERPFLAPSGVQMVRIDRRTGRRVFGEWPSGEPLAGVIWEAFRPDAQPRRGALQDEIDEMRDMVIAQLRRREQGGSQGVSSGITDTPGNFAEEQGGLY